MHKGVLIGLFIFLALFGVADSWYIYANEASKTALTCDISGLDGCNVVASSQYANFMGVSLALYGVGFYGILFMLAVLLIFMPVRSLFRMLYWFTVLGVIASIIFIGIQLTLIKAICIYCMASALASFLLMGISHWLYTRFAPPPLAVVS